MMRMLFYQPAFVPLGGSPWAWALSTRSWPWTKARGLGEIWEAVGAASFGGWYSSASVKELDGHVGGMVINPMGFTIF